MSKPYPDSPAEYGEKGDRTIRVEIMGEIEKPGFYNLKSDASLLEAINTAGGFSPFAVSRFSIVRGEQVFRISIGVSGSHYFSKDTVDYLPLWTLRDGDIVHVSMVGPY